MTKADYQFEILQLLTLYYDNDRDKALQVYRNPHHMFRDKTGLRRSMEEVVESGNGREVLNFLEMILDG